MGKKSGRSGKSGSAKGASLGTSARVGNNGIRQSLPRPALSALGASASSSPPKPVYRAAGAVRRLVTAQRMAVARAEHDRRVAAGFLAAPANVKPRVSRLNISTALKATTTPDPSPVKNRRSEKARDNLLRCKERPEPRKDRKPLGGAGSSKRFVPWCG